MPPSKRLVRHAKEYAKYNFYCSSDTKILKFDEADYTDECLIIGTGGQANIKIDSNFSCSGDNFIVRSNSSDVINKYIYYYIKRHIDKVNKLFSGMTIKHLSKTSLQEFEINIPSLEIQKKIVTEIDQIIKTNQFLADAVKGYINTFIAKYDLK